MSSTKARLVQSISSPADYLFPPTVSLLTKKYFLPWEFPIAKKSPFKRICNFYEYLLPRVSLTTRWPAWRCSLLCAASPPSALFSWRGNRSKGWFPPMFFVVGLINVLGALLALVQLNDHDFVSWVWFDSGFCQICLDWLLVIRCLTSNRYLTLNVISPNFPL